MIGDGAGPGIEQFLAGIEAKARGTSISGTIETPRITSPCRKILHVDVPGEKSLVFIGVEHQGLEGLRTVGTLIEQQLGPSGVQSENGKIDTVLIRNRPVWITSSR